MSGTKKAGIGIVLAAIMVPFAWHVVSSPPRQGKTINEQWEKADKLFSIRVTAYAEENGGLDAGAYYAFESKEVGSDTWNSVTTFRHDDPVPIARDQVRFVDKTTAYFFFGWVYAVTTDAGRTWSVWNAVRDLPAWQCCNYKLIRDVVLTDGGKGTMLLNPIPDRRGEMPVLFTTDYGRQWSNQ